MRYKFTIFTPTYNRAYTLRRVFDSLMNQTLPHDQFEWILINDGSTDETDRLVKEFLKEADFDIRYIKHDNRGKNYCHNEAIKIARGELFLILDSDDAMIEKSLEIFAGYWKLINERDKEEIYGIFCLCKDGYSNQLIGKKLEEGMVDDAYAWKHRNRVYFESWSALNTRVFQNYLFPNQDGVKFIPEAFIWDRAALRRKLYVTKEILRIVYHQQDGFTKNIVKSYKDHAKGRFIYHRMVINDLFFELVKYNPMRLIKDFVQYGRMGLHSGYSLRKIIQEVVGFRKCLVLLFLPISYFLYTKDRNVR